MSYSIGDADDVAWIREATSLGVTIGSAIPPGFASYATIIIPDDDAARRQHDQTLIELLRRYTPDRYWWLGYLDTGDGSIPFPNAPKVCLYADWQYVLLEAGPDQALSLREHHWSRTRTLPDLMFPEDRSWLVSTLWDDAWRSMGGPAALIDIVLDADALEARIVDFGDDATPPGHTAY